MCVVIALLGHLKKRMSKRETTVRISVPEGWVSSLFISGY